MADSVDRQTRSRIMSRVRSKDTRTELELRRGLWKRGVRGWRCNVRAVFGAPDLLWKGRRIAVFVDSAWWHGHPSRWTPGKLPPKWDEKITRNKRRDEEVNQVLTEEGWTVIRLWDFELQRDLESCVSRVADAVAATNRGLQPSAPADSGSRR